MKEWWRKGGREGVPRRNGQQLQQQQQQKSRQAVSNSIIAKHYTKTVERKGTESMRHKQC